MITDLYKQKTSLELSWQQEHNLHGRYTLDMVRIDSKIREVINISVEDMLERMKSLSPEDRFQLFMEVGEWIFNDFDIDDELIFPSELLKDESR